MSKLMGTYTVHMYSISRYPSVWNSLPDNLRDPAVGSDSFRRSLKTFLFATYWDMQRYKFTFTYLLTYLQVSAWEQGTLSVWQLHQNGDVDEWFVELTDTTVCVCLMCAVYYECAPRSGSCAARASCSTWPRTPPTWSESIARCGNGTRRASRSTTSQK